MTKIETHKIIAFEDSSAFYSWLEKNHLEYTELWVQIYKNSTGVKSHDKDSYLQCFTPRRAKSNWSKRNVEHVENLIKDGLMQEAGMAHVRSAQVDGRWEAAYAPISGIVLPEDFLLSIDQNPQAKLFYQTLSKSYKFIIANALQSAKKPETRERRLNKYLLMLENQKKPK